jgi:hypothetical protein
VTSGEYDRLCGAASRAGTSVSAVIRRAIVQQHPRDDPDGDED